MEFIKANLKSLAAHYCKSEPSYATCLMAKDGREGIYSVLEVQDFNDENTVYCGRKLVFGDYVSILYPEQLDIVPMTSDEQDRCVELYDEFCTMHKNAPYVITGTLYGTEPTFGDYDVKHQYPDYAKIDTKEFTDLDIPKNLDGAKVWLLENHPDYYFGANIVQKCPSGNFSMIAIPRYFEYKYQTTDRKYILEQEASHYGVKLGPVKENGVAKSLEEKRAHRFAQAQSLCPIDISDDVDQEISK